MTKEKQIEEMTKITCNMYCRDREKKCAGVQECDMKCLHYQRCEALYEAGYRKQSENTVELSCKAGDIVYQLAHGYAEKEIVRCPYVEYLTNGYSFTEKDIGVTVFIGENAKEEAEKALAKALAKAKGGTE